MTRKQYVEKARYTYANEECEIDDKPRVSVCEDGAWVQAWVWVSEEEE